MAQNVEPHGSSGPIDPASAVTAVAVRALESRLGDVVRALPQAARHSHEDEELVHGLRIASRRAVAALEIFADLLPRRRTRRLTRVLERIRRAAGKARDLDVLLGRWRAEAYALPSMRRRVERSRRKAQKPLVALHERLFRKDRLVRDISKLLRKVRVRAPVPLDGREPRFGVWSGEVLLARVEGFFSAARRFSESEAELHPFRIAGKRLRYAIEILAGAFPPELSRELYPTIALVHAKTGKVTDHVTACARLRKQLARTASGYKADAVARLLRVEEAHLKDASQAFAAWWTPERSDELHARLLAQNPLALASRRPAP